MVAITNDLNCEFCCLEFSTSDIFLTTFERKSSFEIHFQHIYTSYTSCISTNAKKMCYYAFEKQIVLSNLIRMENL